MEVRIDLWHIVWGAVAYLATGALLYLPLNWLAYRRWIHPKYGPLLDFWRRVRRPKLFVVQVAAWPLAVWEELR